MFLRVGSVRCDAPDRSRTIKACASEKRTGEIDRTDQEDGICQPLYRASGTKPSPAKWFKHSVNCSKVLLPSFIVCRPSLPAGALSNPMVALICFVFQLLQICRVGYFCQVGKAVPLYSWYHTQPSALPSKTGSPREGRHLCVLIPR